MLFMAIIANVISSYGGPVVSIQTMVRILIPDGLRRLPLKRYILISVPVLVHGTLPDSLTYSMKTLSFGSYATNIVGACQTFIICLAILNDVCPKAAARYTNVIALAQSTDHTASERVRINRAIEHIITDLNRHTPQYTYFGHHPTDISHLGVWVDLDAMNKAERAGQLTQVLGSSWRGIKSTFILDMSKEGLTLYRRRSKQAVWTMI